MTEAECRSGARLEFRQIVKPGREILKALCETDYEILAAGRSLKAPEGLDAETYTYRQIADMFYQADGVTNGPVKYVPAFMMDILARLPKIKKEGKADVIRFSKFTLLNDCYGDTEVPGSSFKQYIAEKSYAASIEAEKGL